MCELSMRVVSEDLNWKQEEKKHIRKTKELKEQQNHKNIQANFIIEKMD